MFEIVRYIRSNSMNDIMPKQHHIQLETYDDHNNDPQPSCSESYNVNFRELLDCTVLESQSVYTNTCTSPYIDPMSTTVKHYNVNDTISQYLDDDTMSTTQYLDDATVSHPILFGTFDALACVLIYVIILMVYGSYRNASNCINQVMSTVMFIVGALILMWLHYNSTIYEYNHTVIYIPILILAIVCVLVILQTRYESNMLARSKPNYRTTLTHKIFIVVYFGTVLYICKYKRFNVTVDPFTSIM